MKMITPPFSTDLLESVIV